MQKMGTFCDFCLFDKDITMFPYDFFDLDKSSEFPKIVHTFLFYRIINYWSNVNKTVVNEYFVVLDLNKHLSVNTFENFHLILRLICIDCQHE